MGSPAENKAHHSSPEGSEQDWGRAVRHGTRIKANVRWQVIGVRGSLCIIVVGVGIGIAIEKSLKSNRRECFSVVDTDDKLSGSTGMQCVSGRAGPTDPLLPSYTAASPLLAAADGACSARALPDLWGVVALARPDPSAEIRPRAWFGLFFLK